MCEFDDCDTCTEPDGFDQFFGQPGGDGFDQLFDQEQDDSSDEFDKIFDQDGRGDSFDQFFGQTDNWERTGVSDDIADTPDSPVEDSMEGSDSLGENYSDSSDGWAEDNASDTSEEENEKNEESDNGWDEDGT